MAKSPSSNRPIWPRGLRSRPKALSDRVKDNIETIAESLASHENLDRVDKKHVDAAYDVLSNAGLKQRKFLDRPESWMTLGGFLVGFAWACPDAITLFVNPENARSISIGVLCFCLFSGLFLILFGFYQSKIPTAQSDLDSGNATWKRKLVSLLWVLAILGIVYMIWVRFIHECPNCLTIPEDAALLETPELASPEPSVIVN